MVVLLYCMTWWTSWQSVWDESKELWKDCWLWVEENKTVWLVAWWTMFLWDYRTSHLCEIPTVKDSQWPTFRAQRHYCPSTLVLSAIMMCYWPSAWVRPLTWTITTLFCQLSAFINNHHVTHNMWHPQYKCHEYGHVLLNIFLSTTCASVCVINYINLLLTCVIDQWPDYQHVLLIICVIKYQPDCDMCSTILCA